MKKFFNRKYHFIYKTTCLLNGLIYVGMHSTDDVNDIYLGSSLILKKDILKLGRRNFKREILEFCEYSEMRDREEFWIKKLNAIDYGYNISPTSIPILRGKDHPQYGKHIVILKETRLKISEAHKNMPIVTCPYCGIVGKGSPMKQNHFDNCNENPNYIQRKIRVCLYCGGSGNNHTMTRYHFENCKSKPGYIQDQSKLCPHCGVYCGKKQIASYHYDKCQKNPNRPQKPNMICPHCLTEGTGGKNGTMTRYHFDNCKQNPNRNILCIV